MSAWTTCPHCRLSHSIRPDGCCPRCRRPPAQAPAAAAAPALAASGQAPPPSQATATQAPPAARPKASALSTAASVGGAAIGIGMSRFFGPALIFPGIFAIATAIVLVKLGPERARPFVLALSALVGHLAWMLAGALFAGTFAPVAIDVVLMTAAAVWLVVRPGLAPVVALAMLEVLTTAVNAWQLASPVDAATRKALVLHVLLRLSVLGGLALGYRKLRKDARGLATATLVRTFE